MNLKDFKTYYRSGEIESTVEVINKDNFKIIFFYENNQIKLEAQYKNDNLIGVVNSYYEDGQIQSIRNYEDGKLSGESIFYYETGNIKLKLEYNQNQLDGVVKTYYESGSINSKKKYSNNLLNGKMIIYYENGEIKYEVDYKDNDILQIRSYQENGELEIII